MRGNLPDTNIVLLALAAPERLSGLVREALETGPNIISVLSYWEVALKTSKGKLAVGDLSAWWRAALDDLAATALPLKPDHVAALAHLPPLHHDPFDRGLIGQAMVEELVLLTTDSVIPHYASERLRVVR